MKPKVRYLVSDICLTFEIREVRSFSHQLFLLAGVQKIYVGQIPQNVTEAAIVKVFEQFAPGTPVTLAHVNMAKVSSFLFPFVLLFSSFVLLLKKIIYDFL
tara:strand:+ start:147 stop:449 length:303 start_codon:yes stop_codon:yes gene_type:complete